MMLIIRDIATSDSNLEQDLTGKVKGICSLGEIKSFQQIKKSVSDGYIIDYTL